MSMTRRAGKSLACALCAALSLLPGLAAAGPVVGGGAARGARLGAAAVAGVSAAVAPRLNGLDLGDPGVRASVAPVSRQLQEAVRRLIDESAGAGADASRAPALLEKLELLDAAFASHLDEGQRARIREAARALRGTLSQGERDRLAAKIAAVAEALRLPSGSATVAGAPVLAAARPGSSAPVPARWRLRRAAAAQPAPASRAQDAPVPAAPQLVAFRQHIREFGVYLLEKGATKDDSVGRLLTASSRDEDLRAALGALVAGEGAAALRGRRFYVTGVPMGLEKEAAGRVEGLLAELGAAAGDARVTVLSVPGRRWTDRIKYFLPSRSRDYQAPLRDEVVSGLLTTAVLELPNALYLLSSLTLLDASIVLAVHAALLVAYTVYQRSMVNWLLRSSGMIVFVKQFLMSLPFVLNYNVLGHVSALLAYGHAVGAVVLLSALPAALLRFSVTQGLTLFLQTVFYSWVVTKGFRGWTARQRTPESAEAARSWVNFLLMPWLWIDSIFLAMASTASLVLFSVGAFALTAGHLYLAGLTAAGTVFVLFPSLLDATLPFYQRARAWLGRFSKRKA